MADGRKPFTKPGISFFLEKAGRNRTRALWLAEAAVRLWGNSFYKDHSFSSAERRDAFLAQLKILDAAPARLLECRKDFQEWDLLFSAESA